MLDSNGGFLWGLTGSGNEYEYCSPPLFKPNGNVALAAQYSELMDVDPGPATFELPQPDRTAGLRAEWSRTGAVVNAAPFAHDDDGYGEGLRLLNDPDGGEYLIGRFSKSADLDLTAGVDIFNESLYIRIFISHYSPSGAYEWTGILRQDMENASSSYLYGAGVQPNGNLIIGLDAYGFGLDLDPGPGTAWLGEEGGPWIGWANYNQAGEFQWLRELPRTSSVSLTGLEVASNGRPVMRWNGIGAQDVDPGAGEILLRLPVYGFGFSYLQADGSW